MTGIQQPAGIRPCRVTAYLWVPREGELIAGHRWVTTTQVGGIHLSDASFPTTTGGATAAESSTPPSLSRAIVGLKNQGVHSAKTDVTPGALSIPCRSTRNSNCTREFRRPLACEVEPRERTATWVASNRPQRRTSAVTEAGQNTITLMTSPKNSGRC